MSVKEILKLPYIMFVIGMLDAPHVDYETKKEKTKTVDSVDGQLAAISGVLG